MSKSPDPGSCAGHTVQPVRFSDPEVKKPKPVKRYDDEPLLLEAMQALAASPGRRWLRERGGFEPEHMDVRITTARAYTALVAAVERACAPRPSSDWAR